MMPLPGWSIREKALRPTRGARRPPVFEINFRESFYLRKESCVYRLEHPTNCERFADCSISCQRIPMEQYFHVNWNEILVPSKPILEIIVRGTLVFFMLFLFMRFFLKRQTGVIGIADLLVIVIIADASQNAMGDYHSITEGTILVGTIAFWNYTIDWLGHHFPAFQRFTRPRPLPLVDAGQMMRKNMRHEMITEEELMSQLRQQGVEKVEEVKKAYIEGDGRISVITYQERSTGSQGRERVIS